MMGIVQRGFCLFLEGAMGQGGEEALCTRSVRGKHLWRCFAGMPLLVFWVPWGIAIARPVVIDNIVVPLLATALFFGACAFASAGELAFAYRGRSLQDHMGDALPAGAGCLGCAIAVLAYSAGEASVALQMLAMALTGCAQGIALVRWERSLAGLGDRGVAVCTVGMVFVWSLLAWVLFVCGGSLLCLAGSFGAVSLGLRPRDLPIAEGEVFETRLLVLQTHSFLRRFAGSFAVSGFATTFALSQFASARFAAVTDATLSVLLASAPVLLLVLLCAWAPKRELNFMLSFHLSFVLALLALFPVNPGTPISLNVSVSFCFLWIAALIGSLLMVSSNVNRAFRSWCSPYGVGLAALCLGVAGGALLAAGWARTPDFVTVASGSAEGIVKVSVVTSAALIALFCATNVVLRGSMLRRVELIARGRIMQVMPSVKTVSDGQGDFQERCRRIAFDKGLTPRELDVLVVLGRGNTLARVQSDLVISEGTAITHRRNIYRKLDVHSKQELLDFVEHYAGGEG